MKSTLHLVSAWLLAGLCFASAASAALISRPGGMVYDSDLDITWLQDANYAKTSGYSANGLMNWATATAWSDNLVYGGYSDWRMPTTGQPDASCDGSGYHCVGSELGHLFYQELGVAAGSDVTTGVASELAKFVNIQSYVYWSATEYVPSSTAWAFVFGDGYEGLGGEGVPFFAWAVRSGDVAAAPEPASLSLLVAGLAAWMGGRRRTR